ncbi:MAG: hypothetical protein J6U56_03495 [Spirochaetia bacterium]|nr:hypothetical protein [Spirochaetia bacterium]
MIDVEEADRQYKEIESKYKGTDQWLKSPNGKPTKLTERQWVQVRTPNFIKWFGDWVRAWQKQKLEQTKVKIISKGAFKKVDGLTVQKSAERLFPKPKTYKTTVGNIIIDLRSVKDTLAHGYGQKKLDILPSLQDDFENAVYLSSEKDFSGKEQINHYFAYPIEYDGKRNLVFCRAIQDVNKNRLYVHEVFVEDEIKIKSNTLQTAAHLPEDSKPHGGIALYLKILDDVLSVNPDEVSKVIDPDTGEPLVVYHGTNADFDTFDTSRSSGMFMFTDDQALSEQIANNRNTETARVLGTFLNIRNPKTFDMDGYDWFGNGVGENEGKSINKGRKTNFTYLEATKAKKEGFDGTILNNVTDTGIKSNHYIAFSPNQIKSATDNVGTFSDNPSILFQTEHNIEEDKKSQRTANSVSEAIKEVKKSPDFNTDITNDILGITARITGKGLDKMGGEKATKKSISSRLHALAVANVDFLFKKAYREVVHPDTHNRKEVVQVHRLGSLMLDPTNDKYVPVMLTVIEYKKDGSRIYTVEAVDVTPYKEISPTGQLDAFTDGERQSPIAGLIISLAKDVEIVNQNNSTDSHTNLLFQSAYHGSGASFDKFDTESDEIVNPENDISSQTDTEYLDAVQANDMTKAQAMVDARAREMGYNS